jgi:hypothetical protein
LDIESQGVFHSLRLMSTGQIAIHLWDIMTVSPLKETFAVVPIPPGHALA